MAALLAPWLQKSEVFKSCGLQPEDFEVLAGIAEETRHAPGEAICRAGERSDEVFIVREGEVEFYRKGKRLARQDFAEHFFRSNALHCTAMARVLIPAQCSAIS